MRSGVIAENLIEWLIQLAGFAPTPLLDTFHSVLIARSIVVATKLRIFESLAAGEKSPHEIATELDIDQTATEKLLNVLVSARYVRYRRGRYALRSVVRRWLLESSEVSLRDNILFRELEWTACENLEEFVRTGEPIDAHDILVDDQWSAYQKGMRSIAGMIAGNVARRIPLTGHPDTMLDIGGSHGYYSVALCRRYPGLQSTIIDLPQAVEHAAPLLQAENMGDRIVYQPGDVHQIDMGTNNCDLVFMGQLIHHFDEETNQKLFRRASDALRPGGTLAILDVPRTESPRKGSQTGILFDLFFAITSNAGTWADEDVARWQKSCGLRPRSPIRMLASPGVSLLAATKPVDRQ